MDRTDIAIIRALQAEGRLTNQELAEKVHLSPSPCLRRVRNLEAAGVIRGYSAQIDPKRYGLPLTVFLRITLERHDRDNVTRFEEAVRALDEVVECYLLTGSADYLLRVMAASLEDYERFMRQEIHAIRGIASINTSFAFGEVKRQSVWKAVAPHR